MNTSPELFNYHNGVMQSSVHQLYCSQKDSNFMKTSIGQVCITEMTKQSEYTSTHRRERGRSQTEGMKERRR